MASENTVTTTYTSFTPFPKLPTELRYMIWKLNLPGPRVVELRSNHENRFHEGDGYATSSGPQPVNLRVCRESRHEALDVYALSFPAMDTKGRCYLNPTLDILYLDSLPCDCWLLAASTRELLGTIENVCIPYFPYFWNSRLYDLLTGIKTVSSPTRDGGHFASLMVTPPRPYEHWLAVIEDKIEGARKFHQRREEGLAFPMLVMVVRGNN